MRLIVLTAILCGASAALFFLLATPPRTIDIYGPRSEASSISSVIYEPPLEATVPETSSVQETPKEQNTKGDIAYQTPLPAPPEIVKGIYATGWSAGSAKKMKYLIDLIDRTELNAIVVDIKDYSGFVSYHTGIPEVAAAGAEKDIRIAFPNALLKQLHDKGIYVIGRVSVFQDPMLANAHPEWAMQDNVAGGLWKDRKGLAWMDPAERNVWAYNVAIARDAFARGFDEINFDYVRFASDGDLARIAYPAWDGIAPKHVVIRTFFEYARAELSGKKISADLFGLATVDLGDMGIGQMIEDGYENFDFISPMVYPSHYAPGFLGYKNPASVPYEVVRYSLLGALARLYGEQVPLYGTSANTTVLATTTPTNGSSTASSSVPSPTAASRTFSSKLRPWLQDFNLGATYDAEMVRAQIRATEEVLSGERGERFFAGWLLWNPSNVYTESALHKELSP